MLVLQLLDLKNPTEVAIATYMTKNLVHGRRAAGARVIREGEARRRAGEAVHADVDVVLALGGQPARELELRRLPPRSNLWLWHGWRRRRIGRGCGHDARRRGAPSCGRGTPGRRHFVALCRQPCRKKARSWTKPSVRRKISTADDERVGSEGRRRQEISRATLMTRSLTCMHSVVSLPSSPPPASRPGSPARRKRRSGNRRARRSADRSSGASRMTAA